MNHTVGLLIESAVAVLLIVTIVYCAILDRRLRRLRADEASLKATIAELISASEIAERAIKGLKDVVKECELNVGERLLAAESLSKTLASEVAAAENVLARLGGHTNPARPRSNEEQHDTRAMVAAAKAFAERTRSRVAGAAA